MELRLDEIKGLMVARKEMVAVSDSIGYKNGGFNEALTQQGKRKITGNRDNLIKFFMSSKIRVLIRNISKSEGTFLFRYDQCVQELSDEFISHLNELIEVVPDES